MLNTYSNTLHSRWAKEYTVRSLLNCYCREVAGPNDQLHYDQLNQSQIEEGYPLAFSKRLMETQGQLMRIDLSPVDKYLLVIVDKPSRTYNFRFLSNFLLNRKGAGDEVSWQELSWNDLPQVLRTHLKLI